MKEKITALCLSAALCLSLAGCSSQGSVNSSAPKESKEIDVTTYYVKHNFPEEKINDNEILITAPAGSVLSVDTQFLQYTRMDAECDKKGTIERVDYSTDVYEDGKTYEKYVNVYLPYGYDANDTATKYNVLYFQHGNKQNNDFFKEETYKNRLDNLFASGKVDPVILVFTTYYLVDPETANELRKTQADAPAGDGNYEGVPANFWMEMVQDIIPAVESKYNTYTESFDETGLTASRDHRCFSGYSRGSACTWYMFHSALPYFKWYAPMSASCVAGKVADQEEATNEEAYAYLKEAIDAHPELDFFIYMGSGGPNDESAMNAETMRKQMAYFEKQDAFSFGTDPAKNNFWYVLSNFAHGDLYIPYYYYNSLQVLFSD